jgi:hypothetical protein
MKKNFHKLFGAALWGLAVLAPTGCKELPNMFEGERVVARAGKNELRVMDVEAVFPVGITCADSVRWVENYVDRWVRDQLKLQEASRLFGDDAADEELVEAYRKSLALRRLEQHYVSKAGGDLYSDKDIQTYYNAHKNDFILDRTIVKGRLVAFPTDFRQKSRLKELMSGVAGDELKAMVAKNNFAFREMNDWIEFQQFLDLLPTRRNENYDSLLGHGGVQEMIDGGRTWWFIFTETRSAGATAPLERVSEVVRQTVATRRRAEIIKQSEDSLYNNAMIEQKVAVTL